ncbi:Integrator complex subunit 2 [Balamuthia mandrillaris]
MAEGEACFFEAVHGGCFDVVTEHAAKGKREVVAFLPYLVRLAVETESYEFLLTSLQPFPEVSTVLSYLALPFDQLEAALAEELQHKSKLHAANVREGSLVASLGEELSTEFEAGDAYRRMRLVLSEVMNVIAHWRHFNKHRSEWKRQKRTGKGKGGAQNEPEERLRGSLLYFDAELLGSAAYSGEVELLLPVAVLRCTEALTLSELVQALLCVPMASGRLIKALLCNLPAGRMDILNALLACASVMDSQQDHHQQQLARVVNDVILEFCFLSRASALWIRAMLVRRRLLPELVFQLTLHYIHDEVPFMISLFEDYRWMQSFIKQQQEEAALRQPAATSTERSRRGSAQSSQQQQQLKHGKNRMGGLPKPAKDGSSKSTGKEKVSSGDGGKEEGEAEENFRDKTTAAIARLNKDSKQTNKSTILPLQAMRDRLLLHVGQCIKSLHPATKSTVSFDKQETEPMAINSDTRNSDSSSIRHDSTTLLRLYCGLVGLMKMKLTSEEMNAILDILNYSHEERTTKLGICWLLGCESLLKRRSKDKVKDCVEAMLKGRNCLEMLLLVAIHFHTDQLASIVELIKGTLGLSAISVHSSSLNDMKELFTEELLTEEIVAKKAVALPVVQQLCANESMSFGVMCVYHLLKNKIFLKHEVDVGEWVFSQISNASEPIHHLLPSLLEEWAKCIVGPPEASSGGSFLMQRPSEESIKRVFGASDDQRDHQHRWVEEMTSNERATQVLFLYFVLFYNSYVQSLNVELKNKSQTSSALSRLGGGYSSELVECLPVKALLSWAKAHSTTHYANIYPPLLSLVVSLLPGILIVTNILREEEQEHSTTKRFTEVEEFRYTDLTSQTELGNNFEKDKAEVLQKQSEELANLTINPRPSTLLPVDFVDGVFATCLDNPLRAIFVMRKLQKMKTWQLQRYADSLTFTLLPLLVNYRQKPQMHQIITLFADIWEGLYTLIPFQLAMKTINALTTETMDEVATKPSSPSTRKNTLTHTHVVMDPLIVLRCEPNVFRIPALLKVILQILNSYIVEAHNYINAQIAMEPTGSSKVEEFNTLLLAQDSAVVQALLEVCTKDEEWDKNSTEGVLEEVRIHVCTFLHQLFIENPLMLKLVHFQGYRVDLLPITVLGIPSMHVCLEFLPELLSQPQVEKQIFGVHLAAHLIEKYPLPKSLEVARMVLHKLRTVRATMDDAPSFLLQTISCLPKLVAAFPTFLAEEAVAFLVDITPLAQSTSATSSDMALKHPQLHAEIHSNFRAILKALRQ